LSDAWGDREILDKTEDAIDRTAIFADAATKGLVEKVFAEEETFFFQSEYSERRRRFLEAV
jgi:hypothetical protein